MSLKHHGLKPHTSDTINLLNTSPSYASISLTFTPCNFNAFYFGIFPILAIYKRCYFDLQHAIVKKVIGLEVWIMKNYRQHATRTLHPTTHNAEVIEKQAKTTERQTEKQTKEIFILLASE